MHEMKSLSIFAGTGKCNANCEHCAGIPHRIYAPAKDGAVDESLVYNTLRECYSKGARYLSISGSGEPTLSPKSLTKVFRLISQCRKEGKDYSPVNLYSNGIRIGNDKRFCGKYLPLWKDLGLTTIYITVHDTDEIENARAYGIKKYPSLETVIKRIHDTGLKMRANIILSKKTISTYDKFVEIASNLEALGADRISCWPIRNSADEPDLSLMPAQEEIDKMEAWAEKSSLDIRVLREKSRERYSNRDKLTLFPDGTLSNTWCN